jgi:hypothetical protein
MLPNATLRPPDSENEPSQYCDARLIGIKQKTWRLLSIIAFEA